MGKSTEKEYVITIIVTTDLYYEEIKDTIREAIEDAGINVEKIFVKQG